MEINEMTMEQVEARMAEIQTALEAEDADIEALNAEVDELVARKAAIKEAAIEKRALLDKIAEITAEPIEELKEERKEQMETIEIRNTPEYIHAFANYVKSGNDAECRALLTENASGTIAVPELVYDVVKTAWNKDGVMALVKKSYLKGNLKVGFEISGSDADIHTEGVAVSEESLVLGTVNLVPQAIKKWISISDEALDMADVPYLQYIYAELTYRIAQKAADSLIAKIEACGTQSTTSCVSVPVLKASTIAIGTVAAALSKLTAEASQPVVIMNRATWGDFKTAQYAGSFEADPFEGLPVVFNNSIKSYTAASSNQTYAIVGDLANGALANFPAGDEIQIKRDDYTLATSDLVRFIGREYVALGVIGPDHFVKIQK